MHAGTKPIVCAALLSLTALAGMSGCGRCTQTVGFKGQDPFGRTYYIDGAGNWGYGVTEVPEGLHQAGYDGRVVVFPWSPFHNPALDQTIGRGAARARAKALADEICDYSTAYPGCKVNIIALSAGTGVAVWACESLKPSVKAHNLILLGSSLSSTYDMTEALAHLDGTVFVYHSSQDAVLKWAVPLTGTIDGDSTSESAGMVGLRSTAKLRNRIRNIPWSAEYVSLGWTGSHTSCTAEPFIRRVVAAHVLDGLENYYASARP